MTLEAEQTPPDNAPAVDAAPPADVAPIVDAPIVDAPPAEKADPADWRVAMAGDDEKLLKFLGKYPDQKSALADAKKKNDALLQRAGMKLPENPTDEELAAFRKEQGIPETAEGYLEALPDGLVLGDDDKPVVTEIVAALHGANAPKALVDTMLSTYFDIVERQAAEAERVDADAKNTSDVALRDEWGGDYKRNMNVVAGYMETLPVAVRDALQSARGPDGVTIGNNADIIKWVASLAFQNNPLASVTPATGAAAINMVEDEIKSIESKMGTPAYIKDEAMQARYRDLIEARQRQKAAA